MLTSVFDHPAIHVPNLASQLLSDGFTLQMLAHQAPEHQQGSRTVQAALINRLLIYGCNDEVVEAVLSILTKVNGALTIIRLFECCI